MTRWVGGWVWLNDDLSKKYTRKKTLAACDEKKVGILFRIFFFWKNEPELVCSI
jgi:hypothetical protein